MRYILIAVGAFALAGLVWGIVSVRGDEIKKQDLERWEKNR